MQVRSDSKPYDDINITPMLDLAYVLLIIFIIMTTATVQGNHHRQRRQDLSRHYSSHLVRAA
jgi:biopolymer transport protein ExbD